MGERIKVQNVDISSPLNHETYLVQLPRNQIHRTPPPGRTHIVEEHTRIANDPTKNAFRNKVFLMTGAVLASVIVLSTILHILRATIYNPSSPEFSVKALHVANLGAYLEDGRPVPVYTITLHAKNPNSHMDAKYRPGRPAFLTFKNEDLGKGKFPSIKANGDFLVTVSGKPAEAVEKSLSGAAEKSMELTTDVPLEMRSWLRTERMDVRLYCSFSVKNSLTGKAIKVVSQDCITDP